MINLIIKDFYLLRQVILLYTGLALALTLVAGSFADGFLGVIYILIAGYGLTLRSAYFEDKHNGLVFIRALPVRAQSIVVAKYATAALLLLLVGLFTLTVTALFSLAGEPLVPATELFGLYLQAIAGITLLISVFLAVFFRWGYNQAVNSVRLLFIVFIFLPVILNRFDQSQWLLRLEQALKSVAHLPAFPYLLALSILGVFLLSMIFSMRSITGR